MGIKPITMSLAKLKKYETVGCCGIDCGICPRFHTKGDSACPGCGGESFKEKHPSCGFLTCCVIKNGLEVCSLCKDYPCPRFDAEKDGFDSFVTHRKVFENLDTIKIMGIESFIETQKVRIDILNDLLTNYDDGRSKNIYCLACTLLPIGKLQEVHQFANSLTTTIEIKGKSKRIKELMINAAETLDIDLKLNKKTHR